MTLATITQTRAPLSFVCRVDIEVRAPVACIWALLTDSKGMARWNSTVTLVEGEIREGGKLRIHVAGTDRVFTPKVSGVVEQERMTWTGGFMPLFKGVRTFELVPGDYGFVNFAMAERFSGLLLPFVQSSFPDFGSIFAQFATDLKREAERQAFSP